MVRNVKTKSFDKLKYKLKRLYYLYFKVTVFKNKYSLKTFEM